MKRQNASALINLIFFITVFLAFCAFAIDTSIIYTSRSRLQNITESTALAAAAEYTNQAHSTPSAGEIEQYAIKYFNLLSGSPSNSGKKAIYGVNLNVRIGQNKQVLIEAEAISPTFFLAFMGVNSVKLEAKSLAQSETLDVTSYYPNINWITAKAAYHTDIISESSNLHDTAILSTLGEYPSASLFAVDASMTTELPKFELMDKSTANQPLSLGPGGFITIRLPAPIINKPGPDLFIKELGALEGYMVFAGIDNSVNSPYMQYSKPGAGVSWKNISCSGKPEDKNAIIKPYKKETATLGEQAKFYGSAYFDIGDTCINSGSGLSMAKYIRIIDDNDESALQKSSYKPSDSVYYQTLQLGEASTPTAGADIDYVQVMNHVKLLPPSEFNP